MLLAALGAYLGYPYGRGGAALGAAVGILSGYLISAALFPQTASVSGDPMPAIPGNPPERGHYVTGGERYIRCGTH